MHGPSELGLQGPAGVFLIVTQGTGKVIPDGGRRNPILESKVEGRSLKSFYAKSKTVVFTSKAEGDNEEFKAYR